LVAAGVADSNKVLGCSEMLPAVVGCGDYRLQLRLTAKVFGKERHDFSGIDNHRPPLLPYSSTTYTTLPTNLLITSFIHPPMYPPTNSEYLRWPRQFYFFPLLAPASPAFGMASEAGKSESELMNRHIHSNRNSVYNTKR
jgi:hypothetical protein